jgi:hypothetical protein
LAVISVRAAMEVFQFTESMSDVSVFVSTFVNITNVLTTITKLVTKY